MTPLRQWTALAVLLLPVLLISIDMSVLGIAVPALSADLDPTAAQLLWIIDLYSFLLAGLLVLMGSLGDRYGRKRLLMIGAPLFGAASLMAAMSTSAEMLIAARALLGLGGATLMPSTLGLIRTIFPERAKRRLAIAVWTMGFAGGASLGPVIGGILLEHFYWGSVFFLNVPVIALFLLAAPFLLPESKDPNPGAFDVPSAAMSIVGLISVVYALKSLVKGTDPLALVALVVGVVTLALFVRRQRRLASPMIDLTLFSRPGFAPAVLINIIAVFTVMGVMFFFPQYLMLVRGLGSAEAGLWMLPLAAATMVGTMGAPLLARWVPVRTVVMTGAALLVLGFLAVTFVDQVATLAMIIGASMLIGVGSGLAETLTNDVILTTAPPSRAGAAAAISETGYEFGGAMGTAVLGTAGMAAYGATLANAAEDLDVGQAQVEAGRQTLATAHEVGQALPGEIGARFTEAANAAFGTGLDVVAWVCVGVGSLMLVLAWRGLREDAQDGAEHERTLDREVPSHA